MSPDAAPRPDAAVPGPDASIPPDASVDAPVAVVRCDPNKPFGAPVPVPNVNSPKRDQGAVLLDELTMFFGTDRAPGGIYTATRSTPTSPFSTPTALTAVNTSGAASGPTLTADGKTMYYAVVSASAKGEIYVTARPSTAATFPPGTAVTQVNTSEEELDPFITPDGTALYFDSSRGSTALHLFSAVRRGDGSFDVPQPLANVNTTVVDGHPVLTQDGLTLYWSSTRADGGHEGGTDIWTATRSSTAGSFATPVRVDELSSENNESLSWIAPDNCSALLQSDRAGTLGAQDIFEAVRPM